MENPQKNSNTITPEQKLALEFFGCDTSVSTYKEARDLIQPYTRLWWNSDRFKAYKWKHRARIWKDAELLEKTMIYYRDVEFYIREHFTDEIAHTTAEKAFSLGITEEGLLDYLKDTQPTIFLTDKARSAKLAKAQQENERMEEYRNRKEAEHNGDDEDDNDQKLIRCEKCKKFYLENNGSCSHCGYDPNNKSSGCGKALVVGAAVIIFFMFVPFCNRLLESESTETNQKPTPQEKAQPQPTAQERKDEIIRAKIIDGATQALTHSSNQYNSVSWGKLIYNSEFNEYYIEHKFTYLNKDGETIEAHKICVADSEANNIKMADFEE